MKNGVLHYRGIMQQLWMLFMAAVFMADASALVLGDDIRVNSALGMPFNARIAISELTEAEAQQLKMRLAANQDYKKLGLIYPDNHKFGFQLISEQGRQLYIQVTTQRPVLDPFVDLLIEVTSVEGRLVKSYTALLDPAPNALSEGSHEDVQHGHASSETTPPSVQPDVSARVPVKAHATLYKRQHRKPLPAKAVQGAEHRQMKLSMSLSISRYDPSTSVSTSNDALQEELIAKEKLLNDLKLQIGEMQMVIKDLKEKQTNQAIVMAASGVAEAVPAASQVAASQVAASQVAASQVAASQVAASQVAASQVAASQVAASQVAAVSYAESGKNASVATMPVHDAWKKPVYTLVSLLTVVSCLFWFRGRMNRSRPGPFDDLHRDEADRLSDDADSVVHVEDSASPLALKQPASSKSGASSEQKAQSVPPEYAVLMEANKHLRAGNEELAKEALLRAIGINPNNAYGYLALLKIYEKCGDKTGFEKIARQLQLAGDTASFNEAAEMGSRLDPDNPLYATGKKG